MKLTDYARYYFNLARISYHQSRMSKEVSSISPLSHADAIQDIALATKSIAKRLGKDTKALDDAITSSSFAKNY